MQALQKVDAILAKVLRWFVIALCVGIALILFLRVLIRFTPLLIPLSWTDEVVEWMMAWMIFTTATLITRDGGHFRVDLLQAKYAGKKRVDALNLFISVLGIVFFAALLVYSIRLVAGATFSPILKVSMGVPYASIPVNCALMLVYLLRDFVRDFSRLIGKTSPEKA